MNGASNSAHEKSETNAQMAKRLLSSTTENESGSWRQRDRSGNATAIRVVLACVGCVVIAGIVVFLVFYSYSKDNTETLLCDEDAIQLSTAHVRCKDKLIFHENCKNKNTKNSWAKSNKQFDWLSQRLVSIETWTSPLYIAEENSCALQISLMTGSDVNMSLVLLTPHEDYRIYDTVRMTANTCQGIVYGEQRMKESGFKFRVMLSFDLIPTSNNSRVAVTSLPCAVRLSDMLYEPKLHASPEFRKLRLFDHNLCSVEIKERKFFYCDWWNLRDGDSADFEMMQSHDCVANSANMDNDFWFFGVNSKPAQESRALLISPIVTRESDYLNLELWYIFKCNDVALNVYLLPANSPLYKALTSGTLVHTIANYPEHASWNFRSIKIQLPPEHDSYHVIIEGVVPSSTASSCAYHYCQVNRPEEALAPMLGLDDITMVLGLPECRSSKANSTKLDCSFQTPERQPTTCLWRSSIPPYFPTYYSEYADWTAINESEAVAMEFGDSLDGRGFLLMFDATSKLDSSPYVVSPPLVANSNCTCNMTFLYLLPQYQVPRVQVALKYENMTSSDVQWSLFGPQGDEWSQAKVTLNLRRHLTFKIYIEVKEIYSGKADIFIDDIKFYNCDFQPRTV